MAKTTKLLDQANVQVLLVREIRAALAKGKRKPDEACLQQSSGSRSSAYLVAVECDSPGLEDEGLGFFLDTEPSKPRPFFFDKTDSPQPLASQRQSLTTKTAEVQGPIKGAAGLLPQYSAQVVRRPRAEDGEPRAVARESPAIHPCFRDRLGTSLSSTAPRP